MSTIKYLIGQQEIEVIASNSHIEKTRRHRLIDESLQWDYKYKDFLYFEIPIEYENEANKVEFSSMGTTYKKCFRTNGFACQVYSEAVTDNLLLFEFGKDNEVYASFKYMINFTGWKKIGMSYERGFMKGKPQQGMNFFRITSLSEGKGTVFFEGINPSAEINANTVYHTMCRQVKNLKMHTKRNFWGEQYEQCGIHYNRPLFLKEKIVTEEQKKALDQIENRILEIHHEMDMPPHQALQWTSDRAKELHKSFEIEYIDGFVTGNLISDTTPYVYALKVLAMEYNKTDDEELFGLYTQLMDNLIDQSPYLNWYNGRGLASSMLIIKDKLDQEKVLLKYNKYLKEAYEFNKVLDVTSKNGFADTRFVDTDDIGMELPSHLICILLMEDSPEKVQLMRHFKFYLENYCLGYAPGNASGYKPDGTAYHHGGYIRQYEIVANYSLARVLYALSDTMFMINQEAIDRFVKVLDTAFTIYNGTFESFTVSPYEANKNNRASVVEFAHMANALHSEDLARKYVALASTSSHEMKNPNYEKFIDTGIEPIKEVTSHNTFPYLAAAYHRRKDWTLGVRGHSRYVYPTEVWSDATGAGNRYSAFMLLRSFGFLEISHMPKLDEGTNNGIYIEEGFDYRKWSGTTAPQVPYEQIKSNPVWIEDEWAEWLHSDQTFVGGVTNKDNGVFAMKLHGNKKYGLDSFYANKSYHFYDDFVLCLGSGITNEIELYETQTTLFQDCGTGAIKEDNILMDNRNNGYLLIGNQEVSFYTKHNQSRDMKDLNDTDGIRTFALIEHGKAPDDEKYAYLIKVDTTLEEMKAIDRDNIQIIRQDNRAHISRMFDTTHYVMFTKDYELHHEILDGVTESCILSITENNRKVTLAIADPDLRFYQGVCEDYDLDNNYQEHSVYGRHWANNKSMPSRIWVIINGNINTVSSVSGEFSIVDQCNGKTIFEFVLKDGLTTQIEFDLK